MPASIDDALRVKERIIEELSAKLGPEGVERARRDHHARRQPIPCGMTIHTGVGCGYGCVYCYIYDMGFPGRATPYPLSGEELVLALAFNPYFIPGRWGTLLAFGSVTEPFARETRARAFEYLRATRDWLGNPQQVSTKTALDGDDFKEFVSSADPEIDVLVTVTTLRHWRRLEPGASPPEERFEFMERLGRHGFQATLFLRPIIPGVTDVEAEEIIKRAAEAGVERVVLGTLRVTPGILARLRASGVVDASLIEARLPRPSRDPRDQVPIRARDLKEKVARIARDYGLRVLPSSCSSNIEAHGQACAACRMGPCGDPARLPPVDEDSVKLLLERAGLKPVTVRIAGYKVQARVKGPRHARRLAEHWIIGLYRRIPVLKEA
ncbi:radical SAM protein [Stetteria hydrogenophila]